MDLISRRKIYKKISGNAYVPFRGPFQKFLPVLIGDIVEALPSPNAFFRHSLAGSAEIIRHFCATPSLHNLSETVHEMEYGKDYPNSQGNVYLFKSWLKHSNYIS